MFTFALAFFCRLSIFFSSFSTSFCFLQTEEEGIRNKDFTSARRSMSNWSLCLLYSLLFIFSKSKCISKAWRKRMNYKQENRIPRLFTDKNYLPFPWLWTIFVFSRVFPVHGNPEPGLEERYRLENGTYIIFLANFYLNNLALERLLTLACNGTLHTAWSDVHAYNR